MLTNLTTARVPLCYLWVLLELDKVICLIFLWQHTHKSRKSLENNCYQARQIYKEDYNKSPLNAIILFLECEIEGFQDAHMLVATGSTAYLKNSGEVYVVAHLVFLKGRASFSAEGVHCVQKPCKAIGKYKG